MDSAGKRTAKRPKLATKIESQEATKQQVGRRQDGRSRLRASNPDHDDDKMNSKSPVKQEATQRQPSDSSKQLDELKLSNDRPKVTNQAKQILIEKKLLSRSRKLSACLILLTGAVSCLNQFIGDHLTKRIGLLLFEGELIRLQSSYLTVILAAAILVILSLIAVFLFNWKRKKLSSLFNSNKTHSTKFSNEINKENSLLLQRILKHLISLFALISGVCFLAIGLVVPHVKQIQRMPVATFDCNANLITIENCRQQFAGGQLGLAEALGELLVGKLVAKTPLNTRLNCLQFRQAESIKQPTRFLLYHCNLVCRPQSQQLHQFGDDLNSATSQPLEVVAQAKLVPPYQREQDDEQRAADASPFGERNLNFRNGSANQMGELAGRQISIKICFSGELAGGQSSYKQFCITNLANQQQPSGQPMTVGQFNAMLRSSASAEMTASLPEQASPSLASTQRSRPSVESQSTSYVNPVVQFESHFRPQSPTRGQPTSTEPASAQGGTCNFRPIPPFIVNNKPFNEIQCSLEHEYTISMGPSTDYLPTGIDFEQSAKLNGKAASTDHASSRIYLKRALGDEQQPGGEHLLRERCNIQCKVNILYQVQLGGQQGERENSNEKDDWTAPRHYYLPLRPCVVLAGPGDLLITSSRYLLFRTLGELCLLLTLILLDLMLLVECMDTRQSPLESRRRRTVGLVLVLLLVPLVAAISFDLAARWWPQQTITNPLTMENERDSSMQDSSRLDEPSLVERLMALIADILGFSHLSRRNLTASSKDANVIESTTRSIDAFLVPLFVYATLMFALALCSWTLEPVSSMASLSGSSSLENLGLLAEPAIELEQRDDQSREEVSCSPKAKLVRLSLLSLFLGLQFNFSQSLAGKIFAEAFGSPGDGQRSDEPASFTATLFVVSTNSTGALVSLILVLVFANETSTFFASSMQPFKSLLSSQSSEDLTRNGRRETDKFLWIVSVVILVYAFRFGALSQITRGSRIKWLLAFLYQMGELLSFPAAWLALTTRLHELVSTLRLKKTDDDHQMDVHLLSRLALAFIYFCLGRSLALLSHTLQVSLEMHSDDVDWFVASFYGLTGSGSIDETQQGNRTASQPMFSPLPGDELTYQHASHKFLRYNALVCLLVGVYLLAGRLRLRLNEWAQRRAERKRLAAIAASRKLRQRTGASGSPSQSLDERLSLDLMRIHEAKQPATRTIYPTAGQSVDEQQPSPRAKILFHYDVGRGDESPSTETVSQQPKGVRPIETRVPILIEDSHAQREVPSKMHELKDLRKDIRGATGQQLTTERRFVSHRSKRVKIFEDEEIWPPNDVEINLPDDKQLPAAGHKQPSKGKTMKTERRITFAPNATLIDGQINERRKLRNNNHRATQAMGKGANHELAMRASPEPSVDGNSNDEAQDSIEARDG